MFLNLRYVLRLTQAFISRFKVILILGILLGIAFFFAINFILPTFFGHKIERIGITGRFTVDSLPDSILELAGSGLTRAKEDGGAEPDMASSWQVSDQGKTWTFHLKDNLYWQDGKKVESTDINYDFSDLTVEKPDKKTIVFKLSNAFSPFPLVVSRPIFKKGFLGTGEWKVTNISLGGDFVQELNLANKEGDKKVYKFYPSEDRTKLAFKLGGVDSIQDIFDISPFLSWKNVLVDQKSDHSKFVALFFNVQDKLLSEKSVRQALAYAIKKEFQGERALSPISPDSWAYNPQVKPYSHDQARAKELIGSLSKELKESLIIKLATNSLLLGEADKIAKDWEGVGVKTNVQVASGIPPDYQAFLTIFDIPTDPDQYSLWHSSQTATNISHYQNPRIDKLLEDGRTTTDQTERKKIYLDFQRFLIEDSPAVFLYRPVSYTITRK